MPKPHAPVRIAVFGTKPYDRHFLYAAKARFDLELTFFEPCLDETPTALAAGFGAVCVFVNDTLNKAVLTALRKSGTRIVALRSAGYNNVDLRAAGRLGMVVVRVPAETTIQSIADASAGGPLEFQIGAEYEAEKKD